MPVNIAPPTRGKVEPPPKGCGVLTLEERVREHAGVSFFMIDAVLVESSWEENGRTVLRLVDIVCLDSCRGHRRMKRGKGLLS